MNEKHAFVSFLFFYDDPPNVRTIQYDINITSQEEKNAFVLFF
jgi:hypothetical protein